MLLKLPFREARKSLSSYGVYSFSLTLAIAIFCSFSSVYRQINDLIGTTIQENSIAALEPLRYTLILADVFVGLMFAFLVVYASTFFYRKKKKDLSLLLMMGLGRGKASLLLILQNLFVSLLSFGCGIGLGIGFSQALGAISCNLFGSNLSSFRFYFSPEGLVLTSCFFVALFILVSFFTCLSVRRTSLKDLYTGSFTEEKRKKPKSRKVLLAMLYISLLLYVVGCSLMAIAFTETCVLVFVIGCLSGFLFFASYSSLSYGKADKKKNYYKGLNPFLYKEFYSRVGSASLTLAFISLSIILTFVLMALGLGMEMDGKRTDNTYLPFAFVGIYMGTSFLITSCAILGMRQLSSSTESRSRYLFLSKLGASRKDILAAATKESALYYIVPLLFAFIPSLTASLGAIRQGKQYLGLDMTAGILISLAIILAIYLLYFVFILFRVRRIVDPERKEG